MKTTMIKNFTFAISLIFLSSLGFSQSEMQEPFAGIEKTKDYKTIDLIYMDKETSIFTNLLRLSGLDASLSMTDRSHTLFLPTNAAFKSMTIENFAELTDPKNRAMLTEFVGRHFTGSKIDSFQLTDSKILDAENEIQIYKDGNTVSVGGATLIASDIETANGIIHVISDVINFEKFD